ncbi:MAG: copper chaperone PCu(A)C [Alphaproteobacteria bacterium]|nr:copper chaperone PCu(A)C [Alphaproteobacteria bacterium]
MKKYFPLLPVIGLVSTAAVAKIQVQNLWVRASTGPNTAAYMKLINTSNKEIYLTDVHSPVSASGELHEIIDMGKGMQMQKISTIQIPSNEEVVLMPGKTHVMLMNIKDSPLTEGKSVPLTLVFNGGEELQLMAPVKAQ